jgi:hypothetical protein
MSFKLSPTTLKAAIKHLCRYGDTDVFPHLPELALYAEETKAVVAELAALDLDNYNPSGAIEVLAPKNTPWSARVLPHFRDRIRILTHRYVREG